MPRRYSAIATSTLCLAAGVALGADIRFGVSPRETYVGMTVQVQVVIDDAKDHMAPVFPEIDGAEVRSAGTSRNMTQMGRQVSVSQTYTYHVIPRRAGTLTIPSISVGADGETFTTTPTTIRVLKSEKGDLLYVQLLGDRNVYVGESIETTLEIWLKPFEKDRIRMDEHEMWRTVDQNNSSWGPFSENLQGRSPQVSYRTEVRPDANGKRQRYFVYSLNRTVWPERPSKTFDAGGVTVVVNYPLAARRSRFMLLGGRHEVTNRRVISTVIEDSPITVKPLPLAGRPARFRGAVGQYAIHASAAPAEVSVGDPITLTLAVRGKGRLETLRAPVLSLQESLIADFRVPDEELAGVMEGGARVFTQSIRAKHDSVTEVPPIEFSFFDPQSEAYTTVRSSSVPIEVKESAKLAVSQVTEGSAGGGATTKLTRIDSGLLANYDDIEALVSQQTLPVGWGTWSVVAGGPLFFVATLLLQRRRERLVGDTGFARRRAAHRTALATIHRAGTNSNEPLAAGIATALTGYVADKCNVPVAGVTRSDAVLQLRTRNVPDVLVSQVDELLAECESAQYGAASHADANDLAKRAQRCVNELERGKL